jgi:hypothetical protein
MNTTHQFLVLLNSSFPMTKKKQTPIDFTKMENCPVCKVSWQGEPIPQESIDKGFYDASSKFFSKVIGLYSREEDRTFAYCCPSCNITWDRDTNQRIPSLPKHQAA